MVKHAANVQGCALRMERLFDEAGFAKDCYSNLGVKKSSVKAIIQDDRVKAVSLTGSEKAGAAVATQAAEVIKKSVLELGGSNAFVVLADADLANTIDTAVKARMINNGQSCIAAKRFILEKSIAEEFTEKFTRKVKALKTGDPLKEDTDIGPMAREDLAEELEKQMKKSIDQGAKLLTGGTRDKTKFEPTILSNVNPGMPAFDEETFGPLAAITVVNSEKEAIEMVNKSRFGLGATICTRDLEKAKKLAYEIEDGAVFINELVKSDPRLPFGGTKISGFGRELGPLGIKEFVNAKTNYIAG
jgi:succinate-semialdehyde dehydrogenase/glutarate-semialdehyde dehydrogenase